MEQDDLAHSLSEVTKQVGYLTEWQGVSTDNPMHEWRNSADQVLTAEKCQQTSGLSSAHQYHDYCMMGKLSPGGEEKLLYCHNGTESKIKAAHGDGRVPLLNPSHQPSLHACQLYSPSEVDWESRGWQLWQRDEEPSRGLCGPLQLSFDSQHCYLCG